MAIGLLPKTLERLMKKLVLSTAIVAALGAGVSTSANAALASNALLNFDAGVTTCLALCSSPSVAVNSVNSGSYFGMDTNGNGTVASTERTAIAQNDGLIVGTIQAASGSHSGAPDSSESPGIDQPWGFFGNTGMHYTASATNVLSASGNTATLDFSGWGVTWNGIAAINMGGGAWGSNANGVADITCAVDCADGDTYTLDYTATVPLGDPSGFGGVKYNLHLVGTIGTAVSAVPVPAAVWLFGSGLLGLVGVARRKKAA